MQLSTDQAKSTAKSLKSGQNYAIIAKLNLLVPDFKLKNTPNLQKKH